MKELNKSITEAVRRNKLILAITGVYAAIFFLIGYNEAVAAWISDWGALLLLCPGLLGLALIMYKKIRRSSGSELTLRPILIAVLCLVTVVVCVVKTIIKITAA